MQEAIEQARSVLVIAHLDPDGDAIGSLTAVGQALEARGKSVTLACEDNVPARFSYLPLAGRVTKSAAGPFDLVIALDCGDAGRMGSPWADLGEPKPPLINIDHHITNDDFGQYNRVVPEASSTAEVLYTLFGELGFEITPGIAISLLTGIVTDTMGFRTSNVGSETLRIAGALVEAGADIADISFVALHRKPLSGLQLWQIGLREMQFEDGLLWTAISYKDMRATGLVGNPSSSGLVNFLADAEDAAIGAVLTETADGSVRVGLRCRPPYDVAAVARQFGGGGHILAAGCTLDGPLDKAEAQIVSACKEAIRRQRPRNQ
jgi:phosphoesterase RecJ-like protein